MNSTNTRPSSAPRFASDLALLSLVACRGDGSNGTTAGDGGGGQVTDTDTSSGGDSSGATNSTTAATTSQPTDPDTTASDTGTGTDGGIMPVDCPGHRLYQCAGYKIGVYEHKPTGAYDWNPTGAGIDPLMCFPAAGYVQQDPENIGFGGHEHQQSPILVCGPDIEGNVNDPDSPLGMEIRDLCMQACAARPIDPIAIPPNLEEWSGLNGEDYVLAYTVCDVGPAVDRVVDSQHGGNTVLCESIQGDPPAYPGAADVGECTNEDENTDCPIEDLEACENWRPDKWVFSTTDKVGNVKSVIHDDFLHSDVTLSAMFACDVQAYVYSSDGTGVAYIDKPDANDFLQRLWLREGANDFSLRAKLSSGWDSWYALNTFDEITNAFEKISTTASEYELRYDDGSGNQVVRSIKIADCTANGDKELCDIADL